MSKSLYDCGGSAFPLALDLAHEFNGSDGMTLRDYFAAKAMQALVSTDKEDIKGTAALAYAQADAMLAERSK